MKNENLPEVGRDVIFETVQNDVFAGVFNGSDYVMPLSNGKTIAFEGREVVAWIYVEDALAAWKREQVRREDSPPVNHVNTAILREEVLRKIQHEYVLADVETALDKYVDAVVKNYEQPPSEDCIGITDLREQRRYEIAKDVLADDIAKSGARKATDVDGLAIDVKTALAYADALLAELEKPQK